MVTRTYALDEVNAALGSLERGTGRGVVVFR
jgi:hypothetical protein